MIKNVRTDRESKLRYYLKNREIILAKKKLYYIKNREWILKRQNEYIKKYRVENP